MSQRLYRPERQEWRSSLPCLGSHPPMYFSIPCIFHPVYFHPMFFFIPCIFQPMYFSSNVFFSVFVLVGSMSGEYSPGLHTTGGDCDSHLLHVHSLWDAGTLTFFFNFLFDFSTFFSFFNVFSELLMANVGGLHGAPINFFTLCFWNPTLNVSIRARRQNISYILCVFVYVCKLWQSLILNICSIFSPPSSSGSLLEPSRR